MQFLREVEHNKAESKEADLLNEGQLDVGVGLGNVEEDALLKLTPQVGNVGAHELVLGEY